VRRPHREPDMTHTRKHRSKVAALLVAMLSGGSLFTSCETRFREAAVSGAKSYLYSGFLPALLEGLVPADFALDEESDG